MLDVLELWPSHLAALPVLLCVAAVVVAAAAACWCGVQVESSMVWVHALLPGGVGCRSSPPWSGSTPCCLVGWCAGRVLHGLGPRLAAWWGGVQVESSMVWVHALLPFSAGDLLDEVHTSGSIQSREYSEHGTTITAYVPPSVFNRWVGGSPRVSTVRGVGAPASWFRGAACFAVAAMCLSGWCGTSVGEWDYELGGA